MEKKDEREQGEYTKKKRRKKQNRIASAIASALCTVIMLVQVAVGVLFCIKLNELDLLPFKFLIVVAVVVLVMAAIQIGLIIQRSGLSLMISAVLGICFTAVVCLGIFYVQRTAETLSSVTNAQTTLDEVSIVVLKDSSYEDVMGLEGESIGVQASADRTNTDLTIESLQQLFEEELTVNEYNGVGDMVQALYDGADQAIVFNEAYRDLILDSFESFDEDTRILTTYTYTSSSSDSSKEGQAKSIASSDGISTPKHVDVTTEPFVIYISGIDTYGEIGTKSRSDVNILAVINPNTEQILLVTTPRDYYVELALEGYPMDKLTHAGIYGVDCSVKTLENLYGIDINYFMRMNFTGFIDIVDALGGVDVKSDFAFIGEAGDYSFEVGINHVNGEQALCFVRERHSFEDGDNQRARNQMAMIKAIVDKATSPSILATYSSVLESVSTTFMTSLSTQEIASFVKMQLDRSIEWDIQTCSANGFESTRTTYSMGSHELYVQLQDTASMLKVSNYIQQVLDGEIVEIEETEAVEQEESTEEN